MRVREAKPILSLTRVRNSPLHIFEAALICLVVRNVRDGTIRAGLLPHGSGETVDTDFFVAAEVEDLSRGAIRTDAGKNTVHDVAHVTEAARLFARTVDRDGFVAKGLSNEGWHDHAIVTCLTRSGGVEQTKHGNRQLMFAMVGESEKFVDRFR